MVTNNTDRNYGFTEEELSIFKKLSSPHLIQQFLDKVTYSSDHFYRSPKNVIRDKKAHCVDGAFFAAAALRMNGYTPLIMEMTAFNDDDHLLAIFKREGRLGAIAKSNFSGIRFREPVFKSLIGLVTSYFEFYYNTAGEKTLRGYSAILNLEKFDKLNWMTCDESLDIIVERLERSKHYPILTTGLINTLVKVDKRSYDAGLLGVNEEGLFKPSTE